MADYTDIQNANLEPGAPWIASTTFALRDNPIAIAEGASGAPRVVEAALRATAVGNDIVATFRGAELSSGDVGTVAEYHAGIIKGGTVRFTGEHRVSGDGAPESSLQVLKNDAVVQSWTTTSTAYVARQVDISVSRGDKISAVLTHGETSGGTSHFRDVYLRADISQSSVVAA